MTRSADTHAVTGRSRSWLARLGVVGFIFFLVKGLAWLIVPGLVALGLFD